MKQIFGLFLLVFVLACQAKVQAPAKDWRNGAIVYQIFPDRFAPSDHLEAKRDLYKAPRTLHAWDELPKRGTLNKDIGLWSHELEFWGGDLQSIQGHLDYLSQLGVEVIYLNPIFKAASNHKYDTQDYRIIDPAFGTRADLKTLTQAAHTRKMKVILDGVFNHMGRQSPLFQEALANPKSPWRSFFNFTDKNKFGYQAWVGVANLPELNMESPRVQNYIYKKRNSVVQSYIRNEGIDGWRLDVGHELGFQFVDEITQAAHHANPEVSVIAEAWNYPEQWLDVSDGVMNMHARELILGLVLGEIAPRVASANWERMVDDGGLETLLKSWIILDNHDRPRLTFQLKDKWQQDMARVLQFTLPGSPCIYYGSELGMKGDDDPMNRAPMRWDLVSEKNQTLAFYKKLIGLHKGEPALRDGDFRVIESAHLFGFMRLTASVRDTLVILANPGDQAVKELLQLRDSRLQNWSKLKDLLSSRELLVKSGTVEVTVPARTTMILKAETAPHEDGYDSYRRTP